MKLRSFFEHPWETISFLLGLELLTNWSEPLAFAPVRHLAAIVTSNPVGKMDRFQPSYICWFLRYFLELLRFWAMPIAKIGQRHMKQHGNYDNINPFERMSPSNNLPQNSGWAKTTQSSPFQLYSPLIWIHHQLFKNWQLPSLLTHFCHAKSQAHIASDIRVTDVGGSRGRPLRWSMAMQGLSRLNKIQQACEKKCWVSLCL